MTYNTIYTGPQVDDAVEKRHAQNTDTALDQGGANEVTAADARAHIDATDNPHAVTKDQVGLGNVTDDAQLKIASNLSDLDSPSTARTNLGLASSAYTDPHHGPLILMRDTLRASIEGKTGGRLTVLYDNAGNPNVMHVLPRFRYEDLGFSTELGTGTCTAFDVGSGSMRGEIFIGAYQACDVGGLACSLPYQNPWVSINYDNAKAACDNKGAGWHLMTVHEWAAVALWCIANGFEPRGNTNHGRAHNAPHEVGVRQDGDTYDPGESTGLANILSGSGPATWRHDGTYAGIADLVGNVWEWQWGLKLVDGEIFVAPDNDYTLAETSWPSTGKFARGDLGGGITLAEEGSAAESTTNVVWTDTALVDGYVSNQLLRRVLVEPSGISLQGRFYARDFGERLPIRGGARNSGSSAGLAALNLYYERSSTNALIGFRPCYVS